MREERYKRRRWCIGGVGDVRRELVLRGEPGWVKVDEVSSVTRRWTVRAVVVLTSVRLSERPIGPLIAMEFEAGSSQPVA